MRADDFYYDGSYLSDRGFIIVQFDEQKGGLLEASAGNTIEFTKAVQMSGRINPLVYTRYSETFQLEFGICKPDGTEVTASEHADIMMWLNRPDFHEFRIVAEDDDISEISFNGSFNVVKQTHRGRTIGFSLTFNSDSPFGFKQSVKKTIAFSSANGSADIVNLSEELGYLYPDKIEITVTSGGDLTLTNTTEGRATVINGCVAGEKITFGGKTRSISTDKTNHDILNNFNYNFPRLYKAYGVEKNTFTSSLPCTVSIEYTPVSKVVL